MNEDGGHLVGSGQGVLVGELQPTAVTGRAGVVAVGVQRLLGGGIVPDGDAEVAAPVLVQLVGVVLSEQAAVVEDGDVGGQAGDLGQQVARHQHGGAVLVGQAGEPGADLRDAGGVQAVDRFVEDKQVGGADEGFGQGQTLQVAQGQSAGAALSVGGRASRSMISWVPPGRRRNWRTSSRFSHTVSSGWAAGASTR